MDATKAYAELLAHVRGTHLLGSAAAVLSWDQEVVMPPGGIDHRARQLATLASLAHARSLEPRMQEWLDACGEAPEMAQEESDFAANVREIRRDHGRAVRLPGALVAELAEVESRAQHEWAKARAASDYQCFRPWLERLLGLQRDKAACLLDPERHAEPWDALLDLHEPGATAAMVQSLFDGLEPRLEELLDRARGRPAGDGAFARVCFPQADQEAFVRAVLPAIGFDLERGRLDRSTHPFCIGTGGDVRLTTRFADDNVLDALGSTLHETGHGLYEQGLGQEHLGTPLGEAVSLGIHESQSRLWENHVGRSRAFWEWCRPLLRQHLGSGVDAFSTSDIHRAANLVAPSLIRVEADEATYDLHVLVRFELERALLSGDLPTADLPAAWNAAYLRHLGVRVPDDRRGCLQDVHWSCGLFGYFPTYTLGNLYAAQFAAAVRRDLGDLDGQLARGEFAPLLGWLRERVHRHGRRLLPEELCRRATGATLSPEPFLAHLQRKLDAC